MRLTAPVLLLCATIVLGGVTSADAMPIPTRVKQCVGFVFGRLPDGHVVAGTGFFVGIKSRSVAGQYYIYFVTARHVLQLPGGKGYHSEIFLRLNTRDGGTEAVRVPLVHEGEKRTVYFPPEDGVDLAVVPMLPDQKKFEYLFLPEEMIVTQGTFGTLGIAEGSDVFFTGLFTPHIGEKRNYPIVRFGRVALITPEKVAWQELKIDLYLMETNSFGGNSGSPVFFYLGSDRVPGSVVVGNPQLYLAGLMKGTFNEEHPLETAAPYRSVESLGIAAVVPAYKIHELLFGAELSAMRK